MKLNPIEKEFLKTMDYIESEKTEKAEEIVLQKLSLKDYKEYEQRKKILETQIKDLKKEYFSKLSDSYSRSSLKERIFKLFSCDYFSIWQRDKHRKHTLQMKIESLPTESLQVLFESLYLAINKTTFYKNFEEESAFWGTEKLIKRPGAKIYRFKWSDHQEDVKSLLIDFDEAIVGGIPCNWCSEGRKSFLVKFDEGEGFQPHCKPCIEKFIKLPANEGITRITFTSSQVEEMFNEE